MAQASPTVADLAGVAHLAQLNEITEALWTLNSGATPPATTRARMLWADTANGVLKQRNAANDGWIIRGSLAEARVVERSSDTILGVADFGKMIVATDGFTQTLEAAATLGDGWRCLYRNSSAEVVTLDANSTEQIDGQTALDLAPGESCLIWCNGTSFYTVGLGAVSADNLLLNGGCSVDQMDHSSATARSDGDYCVDGFFVLTQTAAIQVTRQTDQEAGMPYNIRLTQNQATAQRMGIGQIIRGRNCRHLRSKLARLRARVRFSLGAAVRYAILEWTGTEDQAVKDVVNSWTNSTYTAGQFFKSTTTNVLAVGSLTPTAAAWTDLPVLNGAVGASMTNLIVLIWTEAAAAQNATLDIGQLWCGGGAFRGWTQPIDEVEAERCRAYFERIGGTALGNTMLGTAYANNSTEMDGMMSFGKKIKQPNITVTGSINIDVTGTNPSVASGSVAVSHITLQTAYLALTTSGLTSREGGMLYLVAGTGNYIDVDARLGV